MHGSHNASVFNGLSWLRKEFIQRQESLDRQRNTITTLFTDKKIDTHLPATDGDEVRPSPRFNAWLAESVISTTRLREEENPENPNYTISFEQEQTGIEAFRRVHIVSTPSPLPVHKDGRADALQDDINIPFGAQFYLRIIRDKFPHAPEYLAKRLGQAAWHRVERMKATSDGALSRRSTAIIRDSPLEGFHYLWPVPAVRQRDIAFGATVPGRKSAPSSHIAYEDHTVSFSRVTKPQQSRPILRWDEKALSKIDFYNDYEIIKIWKGMSYS